MVVKGKTSHPFLGGEDGWWYQDSGDSYLILRTKFAIYIFFSERIWISTCVPGTYQQPTMVVHS